MAGLHPFGNTAALLLCHFDRSGEELRNLPAASVCGRLLQLLPADRYLPADEAGSALTEILRLRLRMTCPEGRYSQNALASPLGEEGHEVAKGWTRLHGTLIL